MSDPKRWDLVVGTDSKGSPHTRALAKKKGKWVKWSDVQKLVEAGNEMDNVIASYDPQRKERHNVMRLTDAEYVAVNKWRIAKNPDYYK